MTALLAQIFRHPVKGIGRESLAAVVLTEGRALPCDRQWAVAQEGARVADGEWARCINFLRGAKAPELMAVTARLDEAAGTVALDHPRAGPLTVRPDDADQSGFLAWLAPLIPENRQPPARVIRASGAMTDAQDPWVSLLSLSSLRALSQRAGVVLEPERFRGNLWVDGWAPWHEFGLIGAEVQIGPARLRIEERITRCRATCANPGTGQIDVDTLAVLDEGFGHQDFGVYASVIRGGRIAVGDPVA